MSQADQPNIATTAPDADSGTTAPQLTPIMVEELVASVRQDFERRRSDRRQFEAQWQLNANFVNGNQYCMVDPHGEIVDGDRQFFWQEREVFNHIAPLMETRLAKLGRVRPKMSVRPASGDTSDIRTAKVSTKILNAACERLELDTMISQATMWSELNGSAFYKVSWSAQDGQVMGVLDGQRVCCGDVRIDVCPAYEIFPESLQAEEIESSNSIIHAKAVHVSEIARTWGVAVEGELTDILGMDTASVVGSLDSVSTVPKISRTTRRDYCIVIERYTRPNPDIPHGELVIVAGQKLLHCGPLPYLVGRDGTADLPFVKQDAIKRAGCFFGTTVVERTIPLQRAYNAVKNRKHEFLNRISMGVLAVEDGSVDIENLRDEGLSPGKILLYRVGSTPPRMMDSGRVPMDFAYEEDRLLSEFVQVSGVSEIMRNSTVPSSVTSGVALQLLIEQDDTRLSLTAGNIRAAVRKLAQFVLRLYKQFATQPRLERVVGDEGTVELVSFQSNQLTCDDIVFDTVNELSVTPATQQNMLFELLRNGLLNDSNGRLSDEMRHKVLEVMGYGGWEQTQNINNLHIRRAELEHVRLARGGQVEVDEIDDHRLHISTHTQHLLGGEFDNGRNQALHQRITEHIRMHKAVVQTLAQAQSQTPQA